MKYLLFPALILLALSACSKKQETISVPAEFCKAQYTGQTREYQYTTTSCYAYDKNMICTLPITDYHTGVEKETIVQCIYAEWR